MDKTTLTYQSWCIANGIKIYPIRLKVASERYKIGVQVNDAAPKTGEEIYTATTTTNTVGVYDKIIELYKHFYNKNNK